MLVWDCPAAAAEDDPGIVATAGTEGEEYEEVVVATVMLAAVVMVATAPVVATPTANLVLRAWLRMATWSLTGTCPPRIWRAETPLP